MIFYIYLTLALATLSLPESKSHHHDKNYPSHHKEHHGHNEHHESSSSSSEESSESNEVHKLGYLHSHLHEHEHEHEEKGRGFIAEAFKKMVEMNPLVQMFNKLANTGEVTTMAPITGPIENSSLYKKAIDESPFFEMEVTKYKVCNGLPIHVPQSIVQAAITCQNETESYPCYKTCILNEVGVIKYERFYEPGMVVCVEEIYKGQSEDVLRAFKKKFRECFEDGVKLMVSGPKCVKNNKITDCLKEGFFKLCNTDSDGNSLLKKDDKDKSKTEKGGKDKNKTEKDDD